MASLNIWQIFGLTLLAWCVVAAETLGGRIVGGYLIDIQDVPFIVALQKSYQFCGGSLIAKRYVLTAAHCTAGRDAMNPDFNVRLASKYATWGGLLVPAIQIFQHAEYNASTISFDFSIVKLKDYEESYLPFQIQYAQLPIHENIKDGTELTAAGWGVTQSILESRSILRAVKLFKINREVCRKAYDKYNDITDQMFCAGYIEGGKDSCQGDSGGPLFRENTIWGVISWGYGCAKPNYPGVYAKVVSAKEWIMSTIKEE